MMGKQTNTAVDSAKMAEVRSEYFNSVEVKFQQCLVCKIALCDSVDPYLLEKKDISYSHEVLLSIKFHNVCNYLVLQTLFYTNKQILQKLGGL